MKRFACLVLIYMCSAVTGSAEMRIWTDKKGNTIEAEFVRRHGRKVVLKAANGKTLNVSVAGLCDDDKKYLSKVAAVPPRLEIKVDDDEERDKNSVGYNETSSETVVLQVSIRKTNPERCVAKYKAYIYVLGKWEDTWGDNPESKYKILEVRDFPVAFVDTKKVLFKMSVTTKYTEYSGGYSYEGYFLCIKDEDGKVFSTETNQNILERNVGLVIASKKNDQFDKDFVRQ